ncbi:MAG: hypothetical protein WDW36_008258 [Sanguina aurantia]
MDLTTVSLYAKSPQSVLDLSLLVADGHYTDINPRTASTVTTYAPDGSAKKYIITKIATGGLGFTDAAGDRFVLSASAGQARLSVLLPASGTQRLYFFDAEVPPTTTTSHATTLSNVNTTSSTHADPGRSSTHTFNSTTTTSTPTGTKTVEKVETVTTTKDSKSTETISRNSTDSISTTDTTLTVDTTSVVDTPTAVEITDSKTTATTRTTVDDRLTDTRDSLDTVSSTHDSDSIKATETTSSTSKHAGASPANTTQTSYSTVNTTSTTDTSSATDSRSKTGSTSTRHTSLTTKTTHTSAYLGCYADYVVPKAHAGAAGDDGWTGSQWLMRDLPNAEVDPSNSVEACMQHALGAGSPFFGLEEAQECWVGGGQRFPARTWRSFPLSMAGHAPQPSVGTAVSERVAWRGALGRSLQASSWYGNNHTLVKDVTRRNKVPEARCNLACVGNKLQMCGGGSGAISLYSIATATQVA